MQAVLPEQPHPTSVLAVDDCAVMRELMRASLEAMGYRVQLAESGQAALEAASRTAFDAIVLDVEMPGMDGLRVGQELRRNPKTASTPIAMHTSADEETVRAGFKGYDAYVRKSGSLLTLGQRLEHVIRARRLMLQLSSEAERRAL